MTNKGSILAFTYVGEGTGAAVEPRRTTTGAPAKPAPAPVAEGAVPRYTAAQAAAGKTAFDADCAVCHGNTLTNGPMGPPLAGETFRAAWTGRSCATSPRSPRAWCQGRSPHWRAAARSRPSRAPPRLALGGIVDGIVTAPIHKEAISLAGSTDPGHTEMLQRLCGVARVGMLFWTEYFSVALLTTHLPLAEAIRRVRAKRILDQLLFVEREWAR